MVNHFMFSDDANPFEILGLEPTFQLDLGALNEAYFSRQALTHPDRFVYHAEPERQAASVQASLLNQAYEALKNPLLRAKALLRLRGVDSVAQDDETIQDLDILEEMMDLREALLEAISPHDIATVEGQIQHRLQIVSNAFSEALAQDENQELRTHFLRLTYLSKMHKDLTTRHRQSSVKIL